MIKDFGALLNNIHNATHHMANYRGTQDCIKHRSRDKTYISDEQLHAIKLCIYHGIKVQVEGLAGARISHMCRCTGSQSWRRGDRLPDWVWVKQHPGRCYGALNERLLWQPQRLFTIKLPNEDGACVVYWLALALNAIPENSRNLDPISKFVQLRKALAAVALQLFSVGNIVGCAHFIPQIATSSKKEDGRNERWIVTSHIDLATRNDVCN